MSGFAYMACPVESVDSATGQCAVPLVAVEPPTLFPALSISDGATISAAICAVWAVGFVIREIRRHIARAL